VFVSTTAKHRSRRFGDGIEKQPEPQPRVDE
jgi:hypothetical protein